ncbi:esophagus cancer-related protein 2 [Rattus norvegicus]|uniref:Esophagus cancer-related protein 2 n=1 Tax=Rattus norvegicus TaxID=10116 RepID=A6IXK6_RAT|nr:esophagus cancer-related protein 2 [Rattus norvegicus]
MKLLGGLLLLFTATCLCNSRWTVTYTRSTQ